MRIKLSLNKTDSFFIGSSILAFSSLMLRAAWAGAPTGTDAASILMPLSIVSLTLSGVFMALSLYCFSRELERP